MPKLTPNRGRLVPHFRWRYLAGSLLAITTLTTGGVSAQLFDGPVDRLPVEERVALRNGQVVIVGQQGQYTGRVLVTAPLEITWAVLTDYDNFENFFPNVVDSQLLEANGNRKVFEQVNSVQAFIFSKKTRVRIAATETYLEQIDFNLVEGDLGSLTGVWQIEPVSPQASAPPQQVLITHRVTVEPGSTPSFGLFFSIYEDTLADTLAALKQEIELRFDSLSHRTDSRQHH
ncbi:MAG: SRPBCC family protein [Cyanophyceae cyanobacterium]